MPPKKMISQDLKKLIIDKSSKSMRVSAIARELDLNIKSVSAIIKRYKQDGKLVRERGHRKKILNEDHLSAVREWLMPSALIIVKIISETWLNTSRRASTRRQ